MIDIPNPHYRLTRTNEFLDEHSYFTGILPTHEEYVEIFLPLAKLLGEQPGLLDPENVMRFIAGHKKNSKSWIFDTIENAKNFHKIMKTHPYAIAYDKFYADRRPPTKYTWKLEKVFEEDPSAVG